MAFGKYWRLREMTYVPRGRTCVISGYRGDAILARRCIKQSAPQEL
jgi:hypothetical protein